jgi:two-component system, sensor histidine kinase and response regulator
MTTGAARGATVSPRVQAHADALHGAHNDRIRARTDRLFGALLIAQWLAGIVAAVVVSPRTWAGIESRIHIHVWAAMGLGSAIVMIPVLLTLFRPGRTTTRHAVTIAQMLIGALLIHLTGGRLETHFHVFGSLAFVAFYRDWRVMLTATVVVATDHILRGVFYPQSIYGVAGGAEWRWIEHAWWVVFENTFLVISCIQAQSEMGEIALRHAQLEDSSRQLELHADQSRRLASKNEQLALEAMAATKAKSEFLATMSHELRTPMNAIINYADLAMRRGAKAIAQLTDPGPLQQQHRFASEIRTAGERLLSLINQLLDLSRIEAGKIEVHVEEAPGSDVINRVRKIAEPLMEPNGNELVMNADPDIRFRTDVQKLEQCLINLVGNAAKFTHRGRITVQMNRGIRPNSVVIAVADNGIGMTSEQMDRLFVPFNQADSSITRKYGGSGLGLAITRSIITLLGGTITVESERHKGSTFTITVPMDFEMERAAPADDSRPKGEALVGADIVDVVTAAGAPKRVASGRDA